jgi:hypothetical protein
MTKCDYLISARKVNAERAGEGNERDDDFDDDLTLATLMPLVI